MKRPRDGFGDYVPQGHPTIGFGEYVPKGPVTTIIPRRHPRSDISTSKTETNGLVVNYNAFEELEYWRGETQRQTKEIENLKGEYRRMEERVEYLEDKDKEWRRKFKKIKLENETLAEECEKLKKQCGRETEPPKKATSKAAILPPTEGQLDMVDPEKWRKITKEEVKIRVATHTVQAKEMENVHFDERVEFAVKCWNKRRFEKYCQGFFTTSTLRYLKHVCLSQKQLDSTPFKSTCINQYLAIIGAIRRLGLCKRSEKKDGGSNFHRNMVF